MKIVDVNVLVYAVDRRAAAHETVRSWWENALSADEPIGLPWIVLLGFVRLATNPIVFAQPLTAEEAVEKVETWLGRPNVRIVQESQEHWRILRGLLQETGTAGNLTTDAHLAALAISRGATLASCDADFARYRTLRWENPAAS